MALTLVTDCLHTRKWAFFASMMIKIGRNFLFWLSSRAMLQFTDQVSPTYTAVDLRLCFHWGISRAQYIDTLSWFNVVFAYREHGSGPRKWTFTKRLQTNDSKRLDNSCDWTLTRPSHDSDADSTIFKWLWLEGLVTLTRQKWLGHITADHRKGSTSQNSEKKLRSDSESLDVMDVYTSQKNENTPKNSKTQQPKEY